MASDANVEGTGVVQLSDEVRDHVIDQLNYVCYICVF
jgi:hypothetical protein